MITIDGIATIENVFIREAYKTYNCQPVKILIVQLPKTDHTFVEAMDAVKRAKTITDATDEYITTYYLNGMMTAKEDDNYSYIWMFNPNTVKAENPNARLANLEETVDTLLGGESDV